jgi:hypothetical protein
MNNNMQATYRNEISLHGHSLDVLKSGLQKYIRRGNIKGAMYCLGELDLFSRCEGGERIRTNMIHRLMIIYMEDVGLGGVKSWRHVHQLVYGWLADRTQTKLIQELVHLMCLSKKTRACSHARAHSRFMKEETRSLEELIQEKHWNSIGVLLNQVHQKTHLKEFARIASIMTKAGVKNMDLALKWVGEIKTVERPLFFLLPLLYYLFGGFAFQDAVAERDDDGFIVADFMIEYDDEWKQHCESPTLVFDNYVFDKHTRTGIRGCEFFVNVSSKVENEVFLLPEEFINAYQIKSQKETDYPLIIRCQLVTSKLKTDTVIARSPEGEVVFLKGPFRSDKPIQFFIETQEKKKAAGMPYLSGKLVYLVPDRWECTPLGIRNDLDLSRPWPFLVTNVLFSEKNIKTKVKNSTYWPDTVVMDCEAMNLTVQPLKLKGSQLDDYVRAVRFREENHIGDFADRNFLLGEDGRVYSVDEEGVTTSKTDLEKQLKKQRYNLVVNHIFQ